MFRLSAYIAKLEDRWGKKLGRLWEKHKGKWKLYLPLGLSGWYFYGMLINSIRLGTRATFNQTGEAVDSIWVVNPFRNLLAVFSPAGLAVTLVGALLVCLIAKKGYIWFSGYKYIHDKRGFDILPDGTHGTSGFMSRKEQARIVLTGSIKELDRTFLGKQKDAPDDDDKYAEYVTLRSGSGLTEHTMIYGATGSGKTRGFVKPFIVNRQIQFVQDLAVLQIQNAVAAERRPDIMGHHEDALPALVQPGEKVQNVLAVGFVQRPSRFVSE